MFSVLLLAGLAGCAARPSATRPATASAVAGVATVSGVPPVSWVDPATGHRVWRLTGEANSAGLYFNINAYTPDGSEMVYSAPDGIHVLNFGTGKTRLLVAGSVRTVVVGRRTPTVFYINSAERALYAADVPTGRVRKLAALPPRASIASVNADETQAAGTYIEGTAGQDYGARRVNPAGQSGPLVQPLNKAQMMEERLAARLPLVLFTLDLKTGEQRTLLHSTDWINHLLFSPTDPGLLMFCHEGPWTKVDRIWTIRTDGASPSGGSAAVSIAGQPQLLHKRTMVLEIAGHEFWALDGRKVWYDLQTPKGEDFFLANLNLATGERHWYHLQRDEWSIHFNLTASETLLCGDGGDPSQVARAKDGQWIYLFRPELEPLRGEDPTGLIRPGVLRSERLVNMAKHDYRLEPNVRFSPDGKSVIFTSNMFGASYVFAVEVAKEK